MEDLEVCTETLSAPIRFCFDRLLFRLFSFFLFSLPSPVKAHSRVARRGLLQRVRCRTLL